LPLGKAEGILAKATKAENLTGTGSWFESNSKILSFNDSDSLSNFGTGKLYTDNDSFGRF
jgi:hypothetical protein